MRGLIRDWHNFSKDEPMQPLQILDYCVGKTIDNEGKTVFKNPPVNTAIILESFDEFIEGFDVVHTFLDIYEILKANATMLIFVGTNSQAIPTKIKEFIPVEVFNMPDEEDIKTISKGIAESMIELLGDNFTDKFKVTPDIIEACKGLTWEEIENSVAKCAIETHSFDFRYIMDRKKSIIAQTGYMHFMEPEPIENLGGLKNFKEYWELRTEPFIDPNSIKPKIRAVLCAGFPGTGKTLGAKVLGSILKWPIILFDVGAVKEGIVGETEKKIRRATHIIDSIGRCVFLLDEIEKFFGGTGSGGVSTTSGVDEGMLGHMLTWMQERTSEGILFATANNLDALPPEFKRTGGRWDTIFFVNLPNSNEVKDIINIQNRIWKANVPTDLKLCKQLYDEGWSGGEIRQLAIDSHYESIEHCLKNIPVLSKIDAAKFERTREMAKMFRWANEKEKESKAKVKPRKLRLN
jgi:ATP-dependent 26S proteasome regulatory subunit